jgi:hypothetical protein
MCRRACRRLGRCLVDHSGVCLASRGVVVCSSRRGARHTGARPMRSITRPATATRRADGCKGQQSPRECAVHTVHCQYPVPKLLQGSAGNRSTLAFPPPSFMTFASRATSTMGASLRLKHSNKPSLITRHSHCRVSPSPSQLSSSHHAGAC